MTEQPLTMDTEVPPEHPFQPAGFDFCSHVVAELEQHTVYCGLKRSQHVVQRITIPEPKDGP